MTHSPVDRPTSLKDLGWRTHFAQQLDLEADASFRPMRVVAQHRSHLITVGEDGALTPPPLPDVIVGDWVLVCPTTKSIQRKLDPLSLLKRRSPSSDRETQLIGANIDTLFIVSSCNADFNVARLERYLALAKDADVTPIIILTKSDLAEAPDTFRHAAQNLMPNLIVEVLDARHKDQVAVLQPWCDIGQTIAFVGSSGVGKSTILNSLMGDTIAATQDIREDDAKGRHTTTHRQMHRLAHGGWLMDLPGMRELGMSDISDGINSVFADLADLALTCKFNDCAHETEPGCAITRAIEQGAIDLDRVQRWRKLLAEDHRNAQSLAERHARDRQFGKMIKEIVSHKKR